MKCIMIGAGGMAGAWIRHFLPDFQDRLEVVALVEIRPDVLREQAEWLGLPESARFLQMEDAFGSTPADFCIIVIPPAAHRRAAVGAAQCGMDILSEKPIADTWDDCVAIFEAVRTAGVRMQVVQNYRFTPRILTLKKAVADGAIGRTNYVMSRFAADYRSRGAWGAFRHEIAHSLLVEGTIHHFDQLRNLADADCALISGWEWNPGHPSFDGECCATYAMRMVNGVFAHYEGNCLAAASQNSWHAEYYRVEGDEGAAVLDRDGKVRVLRHTAGKGLTEEDVPPVSAQWEGHKAIIHQFLEWRAGEPEPPTALDDNIKSVAMLFGAIEASERIEVVDVGAKVRALTG
jgi:predicted dehydrogenase